MMDTILELKGITLSFGGLEVLSDVSFTVPKGKITTIVGPNGAGKTSLFNAISGFYKPEAGEIFFKGKEISHLRPPVRAKIGLARSFQNIALFRGMTVIDNIKLGAHSHLKTGLLSALFYLVSANREEMA